MSHKNSQIIKDHVISFSVRRETAPSTPTAISKLCARSGREGAFATASAGLPVVTSIPSETREVLPRGCCQEVCDVTCKQKAIIVSCMCSSFAVLGLLQHIDADYLDYNRSFQPVATNNVLTICLMQFAVMKNGSSCGSLCQHPECWRANLQRVKDAVRLRNGVHSNESVEEKDCDTLAKSRRKSDEGEQVRF